MEKLISDFSGFPIWKKALIIAGLPLIIILVIVRSASGLAFLFDSASRANTDKQSAELDSKIQATAGEVKKEEGKIEQLQEDKNEAVQSQQTTDAVDFYNDRFKPDGK